MLFSFTGVGGGFGLVLRGIGIGSADDLVEREFTADGPNRLWLTDIRGQWTNEGRLYMCAVKDVWSNRIVGYSIGDRMQASLAVRALENAVQQRDYPVGTVLHRPVESGSLSTGAGFRALHLVSVSE